MPTVTLTAEQQKTLLFHSIRCGQYLSAFMKVLDPAHAKLYSVHEMLSLLASVHVQLNKLAIATTSVLQDALRDPMEAEA